MVLRPILLFGLMCLLMTCNKKPTPIVIYEASEQLLNMNELSYDGSKLAPPKFGKLMRDSVPVGQELVVSIFSNDSRFKIVSAFFDCSKTPVQAVDTSTFFLRGCKKALSVQSDTILVAFKSQKHGLFTFPEISIITKDHHHIFRSFKYSFSYSTLSKSNEN